MLVVGLKAKAKKAKTSNVDDIVVKALGRMFMNQKIVGNCESDWCM